MKKKFKMLMAYLRGFKKENIDFEISLYWKTIEESYIYTTNDITETFHSYFDNIVSQFTEELRDEGPGSEEKGGDYFTVRGEIYPFKNEIVFKEILYTVFGTESSGSYYDFEDYGEDDSIYDHFIEVRKFLDEIKTTSVTITYDGSGDSGEVSNEYNSPNGLGEVPMEIDELCYNFLEDFGGWEINEGSSGEIILTKDSIEINHEWNTYDDTEKDITIRVTEDLLL